MEEITVRWADFSKTLNLEDSDLEQVEKIWQQLHEKRHFAYVFWNQFVNIELQNGVRAILADEKEQDKRMRYKANAYSFLTSFHAYIDSIPYFLNKAFSLGLPDHDKNLGMHKGFLTYLEKHSIPCQNALSEIVNTEELSILKAMVNQFKHRDMPVFKFICEKDNQTPMVFEKITYRHKCDENTLENARIDEIIPRLHDALVYKALAVFQV